MLCILVPQNKLGNEILDSESPVSVPWCVRSLWAEAWTWSRPRSDPVVDLLWCGLWSSDASNGNIDTRLHGTSAKVWLLCELVSLQRWQSSSAVIHCLFTVVIFCAGLWCCRVSEDFRCQTISWLFSGSFPRSEILPLVSLEKISLYFSRLYKTTISRIYHPGDGFVGPVLFHYESPC